MFAAFWFWRRPISHPLSYCVVDSVYITITTLHYFVCSGRVLCTVCLCSLYSARVATYLFYVYVVVLCLEDDVSNLRRWSHAAAHHISATKALTKVCIQFTKGLNASSTDETRIVVIAVACAGTPSCQLKIELTEFYVISADRNVRNEMNCACVCCFLAQYRFIGRRDRRKNKMRKIRITNLAVALECFGFSIR